jgi:hypothetical protein
VVAKLTGVACRPVSARFVTSSWSTSTNSRNGLAGGAVTVAEDRLLSSVCQVALAGSTTSAPSRPKGCCISGSAGASEIAPSSTGV